MITPFVFDEDVAIEVILYIAHCVLDPTFHRISKIMYFADKTHLERYGRFICGDNYVSMQHGSVPSFMYDILKVRRFEHFAQGPRRAAGKLGRPKISHRTHKMGLAPMVAHWPFNYACFPKWYG